MGVTVAVDGRLGPITRHALNGLAVQYEDALVAALNGYQFPAPIDLANPPPLTVHGGSLAIRPIQEYLGTGYAEQWNVGVQHELPSGLLVAASYVGTRGTQLFRQNNINYPRGTAPNLVRPYDGFSTIMMMQAGGRSFYQSAQVTAQKRFRKGATVLAAYTFSKALDEASSTTRFFDTATGDPANLRGSWGPATFDRPQRLVVSYNLEIPNPFGANAHGAASILKGWEISGVTTIESGTPFSVMVIETDPTPAWLAVPGLLAVAAILLVYAAVSARQVEISYGE